MGRRSATESVIAILAAFIEQRSWTQAALAERIGIGVPQLRKRLEELSRYIDLEDEHDHPHVHWSVPNNWFPGGVTIPSQAADEVLRQLARAPAGEARDRLLLALAAASRRPSPEGVATVGHEPDEDERLRVLEDACRAGQVLAMRYYSASTGQRDPDRRVSVQRIVLGPFTRFVGHCHREGELRFFRLSRVEALRPEPEARFVRANEADVDRFLGGSVTGYREPGAPVIVAFTVRDPESRWVRDSLPLPMTVAPCSGGLRFSGETAGVLALARFVVGLGEAARAETPELAEAVHELAHGALAANSPTIRSVAPIRSSGSSSGVG
jgi:predicted DNA-binding transcriptional regulator YafY